MKRLGLQSSIYNGLQLKDEIYTAKHHNISTFDIFFDTWSPSDIPEETYRLISELKESNQLFFTIHLPINFFELSYPEQHSFYSFIEFLKPKTITVHYNTLSYDLLKDLVNIAFYNNSILSVENTIPNNHNIYGTDFLAFMIEAKKMLEYSDTKDAFGATVDTGHSFVNGISPDYYVTQLAKNGIKVSTVHLHDNDGNSDSHHPLGTGKIDFYKFFQELENTEQTPYFIIEHWNNFHLSIEYMKNLYIPK